MPQDTILRRVGCAGALEHAAWTKDRGHMQPLRDDLNWFQTSSLDVMSFLVITVVTLLAAAAAALVFLVKWTMRMLQRNGFLSRPKTA